MLDLEAPRLPIAGLSLTLLGAIFVGLGTACLPGVARAQNIILVIGDDMGAESIAAYDEQPSVPPTPTLDALAADGVLFRNAWAYPVCSPFRISVFTGRTPLEHTVGHALDSSEERSHVLDPQAPNLAHLLSIVGYRSSAVGKWHMAVELGWDSVLYFDEILSVTEAHPLLSGMAYYAGNLMGGLNYFNWRKTINGVTAYTQVYATTDTANEALAQVAGSEPYFLWLAFNAPHNPAHEPPAELLADPSIYDFSDSKAQHRAMIEAMDTELGRVLATVDFSTTTVIFVGDNGTPLGLLEGDIPQTHGKTSVYEGGVNVPLIIAGQAVALAARGQEAAGLVQATDLFPTILEIAGAPVPVRQGAVSMLPYLLDPATPSRRDAVFSEIFVPNGGPIDPHEHRRAAREARYKLIRNGSNPDEFYDLDTDPHEIMPLDPGNLTPGQQDAYVRLDQVVVARKATSGAPFAPVAALSKTASATLATLLVTLAVCALWRRSG